MTMLLTAMLPTAMLPTAMLLTAMLPTATLPTAMLPTAMLPTAMLPTAMLPTAMLPTVTLQTAMVPPATFPSTMLPTISLPTAAFQTATPSTATTPPTSSMTMLLWTTSVMATLPTSMGQLAATLGRSALVVLVRIKAMQIPTQGLSTKMSIQPTLIVQAVPLATAHRKKDDNAVVEPTDSSSGVSSTSDDCLMSEAMQRGDTPSKIRGHQGRLKPNQRRRSLTMEFLETSFLIRQLILDKQFL